MPTEKNITKVDPKSKLLYVTLAIPLIGATAALSFGDPTCQDLGGGDETVTSDVDTTSSTVTSETTTSISASTSADTSDTESTLDSAAG